MAAFLCGKGQILWDVTVNTAYVHQLHCSGTEGHVRRQQQGGQLLVSYFVSIRIRSGSDRVPSL
jgi:hypothetical protein